MDYSIDLRPLLDGVVFPIMVTCLAPIAAWALGRIAGLAHVQISAANSARLETAMNSGINFALSRAQDAVDARATLHTKSQIIANAANYVTPKVPKVLATLGVTPAGLAQRIEARLAVKLDTIPLAS